MVATFALWYSLARIVGQLLQLLFNVAASGGIAICITPKTHVFAGGGRLSAVEDISHSTTICLFAALRDLYYIVTLRFMARAKLEDGVR